MSKRVKKNNNQQYSIIAFTIVVFIIFWFTFFKSNTTFDKASARLEIPTGTEYKDMFNIIEKHNLFKSNTTFKWVSNLLGYKQVYPGSYVIKQGMSNFEIVRLLKSGKQTPVNLVIIKIRTLPELSTFLAKQFEPDSTQFINLFNDSTILVQYGTDKAHVIAYFLPNTYNIYWNTTPENILKRMATYHTRFWDNRRLSYCDSIHLKPAQVETLASIVDEETNHADEKPILAGIYINRLQKGMFLQADPTTRFAIGDFTLTQILNIHLEYKSLYNTYIHKGLPPGPICTPTAEGIDAVLHYTHSTYLYFCAKPGGSGYSAYASTYTEHLRNAHAYQQYEKKIRHK